MRQRTGKQMTMVRNITYFKMKSDEQRKDKDHRRRRKRRRGMRSMGGGYSCIDTSRSDDEDSI